MAAARNLDIVFGLTPVNLCTIQLGMKMIICVMCYQLQIWARRET